MADGPSERGEHSLRVILCFSFDHRAPPDELRQFKQDLIDAPQVLHSIELSGTFDFIIEVGVPDLASYHTLMDGLSDRLRKLVLRYETSFVGKRFPKRPPGTKVTKAEDGLWVPFDGGFRRIEAAEITMVTAERDYVRIHVNGGSYLLHGTITSIAQKLDSESFVRIHRSTIVRRQLIDELVHENRRWMARLTDGTTHRISKSRASEVLSLSIGRAPKGLRDSSIPGSTSSIH